MARSLTKDRFLFVAPNDAESFCVWSLALEKPGKPRWETDENSLSYTNLFENREFLKANKGKIFFSKKPESQATNLRKRRTCASCYQSPHLSNFFSCLFQVSKRFNFKNLKT